MVLHFVIPGFLSKSNDFKNILTNWTSTGVISDIFYSKIVVLYLLKFHDFLDISPLNWDYSLSQAELSVEDWVIADGRADIPRVSNAFKRDGSLNLQAISHK